MENSCDFKKRVDRIKESLDKINRLMLERKCEKQASEDHEKTPVPKTNVYPFVRKK
jgi:hypothetical protein